MRVLAAALAVLLAFLLSGCTGGDNSSIGNTPGAFSYGGQVSGKKTMESHVWQNNAQKAMVTWGGQVSAGSFTLIVKDAGTREVYHQKFTEANGGRSDMTSTGAPGDWTVILIFDDLTANMGLSLTSGGGTGCPAGVPGC